MSENQILKEIVQGLSKHFDAQKDWHNEVMRCLKADMPDSIDDYQEQAYQFKVYESPIYPVLALTEEAGEVAALFAKTVRKRDDIETIDTDKLMDELGDVLWNVAVLAREFNISLDAIAVHNINKLRRRKRKGQIARG